MPEIEFDRIEHEIVSRMAAEIRVRPFWGSNSPYLAELQLVGPGARSASGHPNLLWASAVSPRAAIEEVIAMICIWIREPTSKLLVQTENEHERGVEVELGSPRTGTRGEEARA